jgi:hypothetical protein
MNWRTSLGNSQRRYQDYQNMSLIIKTSSRDVVLRIFIPERDANFHYAELGRHRPITGNEYLGNNF